jgi:zinc protease
LKKDIDKGFDLFSDVLLNPVFPQQEIDRKKVLLDGANKQHEEDPFFVAECTFRKGVFW